MNYFTAISKKIRIGGLSLPKVLIILVCSFYVLSELYYIVMLTSVHKTDMSHYYRTSSNVLTGLVPYRDFRLEYPILAIFPMIVPAIVNLFFGSTFTTYCVFFSLQNILFGLIAARFLAKIHLPGTDVVNRLLAYYMMTLFSLPIYLFRYDPFLVALTVIMLYFMINRPILAGAVLMLAIQAKLYPIIFLPILLLFYFFDRDYKRLTLFLLGGAATLAIIFLVSLPLTGLAFFDFLKYHQQRGIQLESTVSGFLLLISKFHWIDVTLSNGFGSFNIDTPSSATILKIITITTPLAFVALFLFLAKIFLKEKKISGSISQSTVIEALGCVMLIFLLFNKAMSPQYVIWLFPFVAFYKRATIIKFAAVVMLTISIYPGWYHLLLSFSPTGIVMLNLRSVLLVWMLVDLLTSLARTKHQHIQHEPETNHS